MLLSGDSGSQVEEIEADSLNLETTMMLFREPPPPDSQSVPLGREAESDTLVVSATGMVSQLTGAQSPSRTDVNWNIAGADLGFTFEYHDETLMVFGDTWGRDGVEGDDWRSNTMVVVEPDPDHGYVITDAVGDEIGEATELLSSLKASGKEYTVIPSAAITVGERMYMHYMSLRDWDMKWWGYKAPVLNGSGFAYSDDGGQTWTKDETAAWPGDTAFSQVAMVQHGQYVYVFGTPAGRFGSAKLFRVPGREILNPLKYEYWTGADWTTNVNRAADVVPAPVGELSVRWNPFHQRWFMMYKNEITHNVVLRTARYLTGPWDAERTIVTGEEYPTLYAPYMLPITGPEVYFTLSLFSPDYQVFVMRFTLNASLTP